MHSLSTEAPSGHVSPRPRVHILRRSDTDVSHSIYLVIMGALEGLKLKRQLGYCRLRSPFSKAKTSAGGSRAIQRSSWVYTSFADRSARSLEDAKLRRQVSSTKGGLASDAKGKHSRSDTAPEAALEASAPSKGKKRLGPFQRMLSLRKSKKASKKTPEAADHPLEDVWRGCSSFHRFDSLEEEEPAKTEGGRETVVKTTVLITYVTTV